jgi:hypothetical protein
MFQLFRNVPRFHVKMAGNALIYIRVMTANVCQDTMALIARLFKMAAPAIHVKTKQRVRVWARISSAHA